MILIQIFRPQQANINQLRKTHNILQIIEDKIKTTTDTKIRNSKMQVNCERKGRMMPK